jgi:hypothetical protein
MPVTIGPDQTGRPALQEGRLLSLSEALDLRRNDFFQVTLELGTLELVIEDASE